jgi:hypothetical protein
MSSEIGGTVVAVFQTAVDAERALDTLRSSGVAADDISVVMRNPERESRVGLDLGSNVLAAAGLGALFGAILGGAAAWFLALGGISLPGAGPSSGVSSIAAILTGAVLGVIIGGLVGGLAGLGIPASPEAEVGGEGRILVTVHTPTGSDVGQVEALLAANGGHEVHAVAVSSVTLPEPALSVADTLAEPPLLTPIAPGITDFSGLQAIAREDEDEEPEMQGTWLAGDVPTDDDETTTEEDVRLDVEASSGETGWYESLSNPPTTSAADREPATQSGLTEDQETWADIVAMERQEESNVNENPEGTNPNAVTGTQGAINPDTGTFGTAGTPVTTGQGASGSTIGTGTAGGEQATQSGDFRGSTPDTANYERGGRGSTDTQATAAPDEPDTTVEDKYARVDADAAPLQQDPATVDVYEAGPSYGPGTRQEVDRTDLYADSDVDTPPTYANTPTDDAQASSGSNMPGTADPRGLGDNTDDVK